MEPPDAAGAYGPITYGQHLVEELETSHRLLQEAATAVFSMCRARLRAHAKTSASKNTNDENIQQEHTDRVQLLRGRRQCEER